MRDFEEWLDAYGRAWEARDPEAGARLYTEEATYRETPFDEPMRGRAAIRAYLEQVPRSQDQVTFSADVLAFTGQEGHARWTASFTRIPSGMRVELDGIFHLRFDESGRCTELREWWHRRETPPDAQPPTKPLPTE